MWILLARSPVDRFAAGCFLLAVYGCARLGDLKLVSEVYLDVKDGSDAGYIEMFSLSHKARAYGNALGLRMPIVAPLKGIGAGCWGHSFIAVASLVGRPLESMHPRIC